MTATCGTCGRGSAVRGGHSGRGGLQGDVVAGTSVGPGPAEARQTMPAYFRRAPADGGSHADKGSVRGS